MPCCDRLLDRPACVPRGSCWRWYRFAGYKRRHAASRLSGRPIDECSFHLTPHARTRPGRRSGGRACGGRATAEGPRQFERAGNLRTHPGQLRNRRPVALAGAGDPGRACFRLVLRSGGGYPAPARAHAEPRRTGGRGPARKAGLAGRLADTRLRQLAESSRLYEAISRLALAERLQRALYAIAEQASAEHDMPALMRSLHTIVSSLMYAENFYIALYDPAGDSVRFPYYVDTLDSDPPPPARNVPLHELLHGIPWTLLRHGRPLFGAADELAQELGGQFQLHGPRCEHCIGVPLFRAGQVVGCIVVQSYRSSVHYTRHDLDLLSYVAQHVQTAIERRSAHVELERRVADRTTALREANRVLRQQVLQRQRGERLQAALFRIAELARTTDSLEDFYPAVHRVIGGLLYARNFYIALGDE